MERRIGAVERIKHLLEEISFTDASGLYPFGIVSTTVRSAYDLAPPVILGAAAARTS